MRPFSYMKDILIQGYDIGVGKYAPRLQFSVWLDENLFDVTSCDGSSRQSLGAF